VDVGVAVGPDSTLHPGTILRGATSVGAGCEIGPHTTILDSQIGDRARVRHALIERAMLPDDTVVGPFVHIEGDA
jgi:bifunctional UDP-N-acetylglucosamine pyrophosphorylase / glucosamine-1-phosphate N-acetyltransferase